jgi:hypothetical protein
VQRAKAHLALARAVVRAWHAKPRCRQLDAVAHKLGGPTDPRWLRRLGRHVRHCEVCAAHGRDLVPAEHLLAGAGVAPALWDLLQRAGRWLSAKPGVLGGAAAVTALTAVTYAVYYLPQEDGPAVTAPPTVAIGQPPPVPSGAGISAVPPAPPGGGFTGVTAATYVVAPDGSDDNPGTVNRPLSTLAKAVSRVRPGQTIALRGGVYRLTDPVEITISGTASKRIVLSNYRGERPVLDGARLPADAAAVTQRGGYWTVQGLEIRGAPGHGYLCRSCRHDIFRALSIHDDGRTGLMLRDADTIGNQVLDSDLFGNHDDAAGGEFADGLGIEYGSGEDNVVRGCRLYRNSDDGLGLHEFTSPVTIDSTWSFDNGVNRWGIADFQGDGFGFKLGGGEESPAAVDHVITNSAAWDNATYGFTESGNPGALTVEHNTAFRNGKTGFAFVRSASAVRANVAVGNGRDHDLGGGVEAAGNSWDLAGWTDDSLVTANPSSALAPRLTDGRLPVTTFLTNDHAVGAHMGR